MAKEESVLRPAALGEAVVWPHAGTTRSNIMKWLEEMIVEGEEPPKKITIKWDGPRRKKRK